MTATASAKRIGDMETPKGRSSSASLEKQMMNHQMETTATAAASMVTPPEHSSNHPFPEANDFSLAASSSVTPQNVKKEKEENLEGMNESSSVMQKQTPICWVNSRDDDDESDALPKNSSNSNLTTILSSKRGGRLRVTPIVSKSSRRSEDETNDGENKKESAPSTIRSSSKSVLKKDVLETKIIAEPSSTQSSTKDQRKSPLLDKCTTPTNEDVYYNNHSSMASHLTKNPDDPNAAAAITTTTFDTSNVLAWLQSPTAMFSPGCFADDSMLNTPKTPSLSSAQKLDAAANPTTVGGTSRSNMLLQTPTVSTSFFFSDVASLKSQHPSYSTPRFVSTSNTATSDTTTTTQPNSAHRSIHNGNNNIICISPLATTRKSGSVVTTPMDLKEIFASPAERRKFPISSTSGRATQDIDAYNTDVMEDEDLSVLLQLAAKSNNSTPLGFRSPSLLKRRSRPEDDMGRHDDELLQLPMIRSNQHPSLASARRLTQKSKSASSEAAENDFCPPHHPPLHRPGGSNGTTLPLSANAHNNSSSSGSKTKEIYVSDKESGKKKGSTYHHPLLYPSSMTPDRPMAALGRPYYPPGGGGSMSITVGGSKSKSGAGGTPPRHYPDYGSYAMYGPAYMGYPPHSMYPPAGVPPSAASAYPPLHMYGAATAVPPYKLPHKGESKGKLGKNESVNSKKRPSLSIGTVEDRSNGLSHASAVPLSAKKAKKAVTPNAGSSSKKKKVSTPSVTPSVDRQKAADMIQNLNAAAGGKNDKAAALAAAILRGVTMRPSGKWQAQLYFAGKSRYIGVFDTREKAALAYEIAREKLKTGHVAASSNSPPPAGGELCMTENLVNLARKAAFDGVSETFLNGSGSPDGSPTAAVNSS